MQKHLMESRTHSKQCYTYLSLRSSRFVGVGPLSMDRYAEIDDEVDVEQCSDSETARNARQAAQISLASPPPSCASDDERSTPEQISVSKFLNITIDK